MRVALGALACALAVAVPGAAAPNRRGLLQAPHGAEWLSAPLMGLATPYAADDDLFDTPGGALPAVLKMPAAGPARAVAAEADAVETAAVTCVVCMAFLHLAVVGARFASRVVAEARGA